MKTTYKQAKVIKEFTTMYHGKEMTVPVGSLVHNKTAGGYCDTYRFWVDWDRQKTDSIIRHYLTHYGLNIPAEYCSEYRAD